MHFKRDDPRWTWRLSYFASMVLPRLLAQKNQSFDICMRVNSWHKKEVEALSDRIKVFDIDPKKRNYVKHGYQDKCKRYFVDFIEYPYLVGFGRYDIQIGLDSDDLILRNDFVDRVKRECDKRGYRPMHIGFQPHIFHTPTLRMFKCPTEYNDVKGSPIFVLYQPEKKKRYMYAYEDSHLLLPRYMGKTIRIEENYCAYSVHEHNSSSKLYPNMEKINL